MPHELDGVVRLPGGRFVLVDSHTHVQAHQFASDRSTAVENAIAGGVTRMIVPGTDLANSREAVEMAHAWPGRIFAAVGTHPHDAAGLTETVLAEQRQLAGDPAVVAIGEIGLDYYRDLSPRDQQQEALRAQLALARDLHLPVILHNRESHADLVRLLREHDGALRGVFHCFIGSRAMAQDALDLGFYLSFAGPLTYPANTELAEVARWAPADRILVETDSPYLAPVPVRGKRNEPLNVLHVARRLAELRGIPFEELASLTAHNTATLFHLPEEETISHASV